MSNRKRRLIISSLIIGLPLVTFLIVNAVLVYRSDCEVAARLEAIRAAGDPVTIADFTTDIPPEEDARAMLESVQEACELIWDVNEEVKFEAMDALGIDPYSDTFDPEQWAAYACSDWPPPTAGPPSGASDPVPIIHAAAKAKGWRRIVEPTQSLAGWSEDTLKGGDDALIRNVPNVLALHISHCLRRAQTRDAVDDIVAMLALAKSFKQGAPTIFNGLVATGIRNAAYDEINSLLQGYEVAPADVDRIAAALDEIDPAAELAACVKAEHACLVTHLRIDIALGGNWFTRPLANRRLLEELDAARPLVENPESILDLDHSSDFEEYSFEDSLMMHRDAYTRNLAQHRTIRVLTALYQRKNPESLLRPDGTLDPAALNLPKEVTVDPYNDKPLVICKNKAGWFVYTVGDNLRDDDGADALSLPSNDVGFTPVPKKKPWPKVP